MTIGSPIDKHLTLWPELFTPYSKPSPAWTSTDPAGRIQWRNYYDYGDPVAFNLDSTRVWLKANGWDHVFEFEEEHDYGFERYIFPGKAHIDYWMDPAVFGHFIQNVIRPPDPRPDSQRPDYSKPPRDSQFSRVVSFVLPYLIPAVTLFLGVYILYRSVRTCTDPQGHETSLQIAHNVGGLAGLIAGMTIVTRIPRMTKNWKLRGLGLGLLASSMFGYAQLVTAEMRAKVGLVFTSLAGSLGPIGEAVDSLGPTTLILGVTGIVSLVVAGIGRRFPRMGLKPLLIMGGLIIAGVVVHNVLEVEESGPVWQIFPGGLTFFYLWWLSALLFDLALAWHLYIRHPIVAELPGQGITFRPRNLPQRLRPAARSDCDRYCHQNSSVPSGGNSSGGPWS